MEFSVNHKIITRNFAGEDTDFIEITDGVYKGVIFKYGRVEFPNIETLDENDENDESVDFKKSNNYCIALNNAIQADLDLL